MKLRTSLAIASLCTMAVPTSLLIQSSGAAVAVANTHAWQTGETAGVMNAEFARIDGKAIRPRVDCKKLFPSARGQRFDGCVTGEQNFRLFDQAS